MSKPVIRKHSAKVLTITKRNGVKCHFVLIGGRWYLNGDSDASVPTKSKDGFWDDESLKEILERRSHYTTKEIAKHYKGCKASVYIREWTTEQVVYGVPF